MATMVEVSRFGFLLRQLRVYRQLSQLSLAIEADVDISYICMLEKGKRTNPSCDVMLKLAEALSLKGAVLELFKREAAMAKNMLKTEEETEDFKRVLQISLMLEEGGESAKAEIRTTLNELIEKLSGDLKK